MAKAKRIEDMSEAELIEKSGKAYDKIMPNPEPGEAAPKPMLPPTGAGAGRGFVNPKPVKQAKGGLTASARADGCVTRGKTKGTFV